jgi:phosphate transport system ATP-binding protein
VQPKCILLDEPCSTLDPISTLKVEELIAELKTLYGIMVHACSRRRGFLTILRSCAGRVEFGETDQILPGHVTRRQELRTSRYG